VIRHTDSCLGCGRRIEVCANRPCELTLDRMAEAGQFQPPPPTKAELKKARKQARRLEKKREKRAKQASEGKTDARGCPRIDSTRWDGI